MDKLSTHAAWRNTLGRRKDAQRPVDALVMCCRCKYWDSELYAKHVVGDCHRYPPTVINEEDAESFTHVLPKTRKEEWCGEFSRT